MKIQCFGYLITLTFLTFIRKSRANNGFYRKGISQASCLSLLVSLAEQEE